MYKLCKTEQSAARQRSLEQGLLNAMQSARYEDINISDLCQRLRVPRKSFYRYFSGKDGALHALIDHTLMEYEACSGIQINSGSTLCRDLEQFFRFWSSHRKLLDALERSALSSVLIQRTVAHALSEGVFSTRFLPADADTDRDCAVTFAVCGLMNMVLCWHRSAFRETPQKLAAIAERLLTRPLLPNTHSSL